MTKAEELARARDERLARLVEHRRGCPEARLETYQARADDGSTARVTRCIDCGRYVVHHADGRVIHHD